MHKTAPTRGDEKSLTVQEAGGGGVWYRQDGWKIQGPILKHLGTISHVYAGEKETNKVNKTENTCRNWIRKKKKDRRLKVASRIK